MPNDTNIQSNNNYTLIKILRTGLSPLSALIGTSSYYGQLLKDPILGSINALLFSKKLGLDIWNLNQKPSTKTKVLNSSKKILLGLGTIGLANYNKFTNTVITPIVPTTTPMPITTTSIPTTTTDIPPWPPLLMATNNDNNALMDWNTYISLNAYGFANLIGGITELIPNNWKNIRKLSNMATGGALISTGVAMGINNDFNNAYAVPTIIAGVNEVIHNLLPMETTHINQEMAETRFWEDSAVNLINEHENQNLYGSTQSIDSLTGDVNYPHSVYCSTTIPL